MTSCAPVGSGSLIVRSSSSRAFCVRRRSSGEAGSATDLILSPRAPVRFAALPQAEACARLLCGLRGLLSTSLARRRRRRRRLIRPRNTCTTLSRRRMGTVASTVSIMHIVRSCVVSLFVRTLGFRSLCFYKDVEDARNSISATLFSFFLSFFPFKVFFQSYPECLPWSSVAASADRSCMRMLSPIGEFLRIEISMNIYTRTRRM